MLVNKVSLLKYDRIEDGMEALVKIRYKDKGTYAHLYNDNGCIRVEFNSKVHAIAPGQSAVFYEGHDVIGGGHILRSIEL
jgi:tRNA-specific 2-thiouridylase